MARALIIFEDTPEGNTSIEVHYDPIPCKGEETEAQGLAHDVFQEIKRSVK